MQETEPRFGSVQFATVYPKRQFNEGDMDSAIKNLNLTPSAVLIVLPVTLFHRFGYLLLVPATFLPKALHLFTKVVSGPLTVNLYRLARLTC